MYTCSVPPLDFRQRLDKTDDVREDIDGFIAMAPAFSATLATLHGGSHLAAQTSAAEPAESHAFSDRFEYP
ncbi:hypothetical protein GGF43_002622 [Coemansia sp. RSA 2618]|nr:hypothetical protein GGF43_002622 [Coemansia sp. RSA 2618]